MYILVKNINMERSENHNIYNQSKCHCHIRNELDMDIKSKQS